ncbi:PSD1 and planctomycete cytochrome C domain-containing protein [Rhodopirellula sallentina]|nr:PSD1 and planctomycete cytochrome C domain-containing protein [Rhodopirellula sallentina]
MIEQLPFNGRIAPYSQRCQRFAVFFTSLSDMFSMTRLLDELHNEIRSPRGNSPGVTVPMPRKDHLQTLYAILSFVVAFHSVSVRVAASEPSETSELPQVVDFNDHVRPILNAHCVSCHGGVKQAGDVSFVYKEQVLPPDGWIVEPGDPESSILIERVMESDPDMRMPPPDHGPALSTGEIAILSRWIEQGAIWDASHWSYAAPKPREVPVVENDEWSTSAVDRFVLARMRDHGLTPSQDASPDRWLRRVCLDLTGLPPTLELREDFLNRYQVDGETARRELVEMLLDSPAFGERWASVWLDQIRYSDSKGLGLDGPRSIWKYRDWVIDSLNNDLPYDQFTIKQIAGDLLPEPSTEDLIATAAHRLTQTNEEGGTDDEEFRVAAVLDRVSTTWQTWMGVTFGCVQCHSHPYDPFRHEEFYQFAAFFNNTADSDLGEDWPNLDAPIEKSDYEEAARIDRKIAELKAEIFETEFAELTRANRWSPVRDMTAKTNKATKVDVEQVDDHEEFFTIDTVTKNTDITLEASLPESMERLTGVRLTAKPLDPETAVADSEWGFVLASFDAELIREGENKPRRLTFKRAISDDPDPIYDPQSTLNAKSSNGFSAYTRIHYPRQAAFVLEDPVEVPPNSRLRVTLRHRKSALGAFALVTRRGHLAVTDDESLYPRLHDDRIRKLRDELSAAKKSRSKIRSVRVPIMRERPTHLKRPTHLFERGLFLTKGEKVMPGTPASLHPLSTTDRSADGELASEDESDDQASPPRLDLAMWLVSNENPLTARVAVNRVWARLFGTGIVASEEDFGSSGELPTHPDLLDYLALRFQRDFGWSMKSLIRELVLSRTYAQSATLTEDRLQRDPENRWLARGPRHRLPSEVVRDQALAVSGLLSDKMHGPPVRPPIPNGVWKPFYGGDKWNTPKPGNQDRYRRSIYTYMKRSIPYPMFAAFDAPSREFCSPRRLRSNTPLQALMMLNDETFVECAEALAKRMREHSDKTRQQLRYGFLLTTCREPSDQDIDDLHELLKSTAEESDESADVDAGLRMVAGVLLNLDEVVMK